MHSSMIFYDIAQHLSKMKERRTHVVYRAACNIMGVLLSQELRAAGVPVLLLHPGFNRTGMTAKYAAIWDKEGAVEPSVGAKVRSVGGARCRTMGASVT